MANKHNSTMYQNVGVSKNQSTSCFTVQNSIWLLNCLPIKIPIIIICYNIDKIRGGPLLTTNKCCNGIVSHSQTAFSSFIFGREARPNIKEKAVWLREASNGTQIHSHIDIIHNNSCSVSQKTL